MSKILSAVAVATAVGGVFGGVALTSSDSPSTDTSDAVVLGFTTSRYDNANENARGLAKQRVVASGTVTGLFPGAVRDLPVALRNDNNFAVAVTDLTVAVRSATPGCSAHVVRVDEFHGSHIVEANATSTKVVAARMHNDAPDSCKSSAFELTYAGTAVKP